MWDELQVISFFFSQNIHQGYPTGTLVCFLKVRERNVPKGHKAVRSSSFARIVLQNFLLFFEKKMELINDVWFQLLDCLNWRVENDIDNILVVSSSFT